MLVASATAYAWFARIQIKITFQEKLALQARGVAFVIAQEVIKGLQLDTNEFDSPLEPWFQPMIVPLSNYGIANVVLKPLDNKIPLNHLFAEEEGKGETLLKGLEDVWKKMWVELGERSTLPAIVLDYIDTDINPRPFGRDGAENINRNLYDISELLGIPEMTPELLYGEPPKLGLADYCTLWSGNTININVAERHVLELINNMDRYIVDEIIKIREKKEITSTQDLESIPGFRGFGTSRFLIGFASTYFNLTIELIDESWNSTRYFDIVFLKKDKRILRWEEK
jgi:type II secretory pathway component PulK